MLPGGNPLLAGGDGPERRLLLRALEAVGSLTDIGHAKWARFFESVIPGHPPRLVEDRGRGHHWAGERATPGLVDTSNVPMGSGKR